ncbi:acetylglutamate kinase [Phycisphaerales bacterium AB-hyl4]|uniref:Acetylglutamate kinase n=1 Tax=Natronomicrosphaera hydrolytica TaxID=3242702 RepID=A0ABV4U803_9BACT
MQDAIDKAAALVEAHKYIRRFEGKTVVVKVGGSIMDEPATLDSLIQDICFMDAVGMRPVLVHGGGKGITEAMKQAGLEAQFVQGRRYTDERTLAIAEHVLVRDINAGIVKRIRELEHKSMGLNSLGSCVTFARRLFLEGDAGRRVDIGYVGEIESINGELVQALVDAQHIPVIAPIARDPSGGKLNVNADSVAGHVAAAVGAEKLVLVSDTHGIRLSEDVNDLASHLTKAQIEELVSKGIISAGMLPKVEASFIALEGGVAKTHIIDGRIPHSLLLEVYTEKGIGTEIVL